MVSRYVNHSSAVARVAYCAMETMGERIKRLRESRGWTQEQMAQRFGVSRAAVSKWERDETNDIRLKTFLAICEEFQLTPNYLVHGPEEVGRSSSGRFGRRRAGS